ncbi:hypothetical protein E9H87_000958 [Escherichia coli]|uniref:MAE_28990/MAE_18760 family HEPN-like nuclease n=1 Tax=Escherichia coli TaxID=562 RepID=UPI000944D5F9|nr:MAE_28990/MAE_18760 family HEPN-like nuclease [Escherichia coli]HAY7408254.1 hypothetical protein [Shigella flexneri]HDQ6949097.1 hypothetical protein [Escherichia coli Ou:H8]EED0551691.1 hypothetical protein [Escherichia coli]EEQ7289774.1 hypothetical protein [Escherichia coli]EES1153386.1 hypothetical protein [Escherichia coli]
MATFIADYLDTVDLQWKEVDILVNEAIRVQNLNEELYNALCRSITVLIVAHMEGFVKGAVKNIISDYSSIKFKDLPNALKRTYCKKYLGFNEKALSSYHETIQCLIDDLEKSEDFKISHEPFIFERNKNPKPDNIENIASRFGVKDIFKNLHDSRFDKVFSMSSTQIKKTLNFISRITKRKVCNFPYKIRKNAYYTAPKKYNGRSLWQTFLDDLNQKRHKIAHGNDFNNVSDINSLIELKDKVRIFQYSFLLVICSEICNS